MSTLRWPGFAFASIALVACVCAFSGLSVSSYWADELFTLSVIQHPDGLAGVWQRSLTDVHPPFYYIVLYLWTQLAGYSEFALRLPSAMFSIASILVFALAARRVASFNAVAFACAAAVLSSFWFDQSQNARNYGLGMFLGSCLLYSALLLHRRLRDRPMEFPFLPIAALALLGFAASFTHAYLFLLFGCLLLYVLITENDRRVRAAIIAIGLVVFLLDMAYFHALMQNMQLDPNEVWFQNDRRFFSDQLRLAFKNISERAALFIVLALILTRVFGRNARSTVGETESEARWVTRLCTFVPLGVVVCGLGVSLLLTPSFSGRNVLVAAPLLWLLFARWFDLVDPLRSRYAALTCVVLLLLMIPELRQIDGRWLPRNQEWRASATFIRELPGCAGATVPVVFPYRFGPPTPAMRGLVEQSFFGHYATGMAALHTYVPAEFATAADDANSPLHAQLETRILEAVAGGCPVLAWGVHDLLETDAIRLAAELARQSEIGSRSVVIRPFDHFERRGSRWRRTPGAYVFLLGDSPAFESVAAAKLKPPSSSDDGSDSTVVVGRTYAYEGVDAGTTYAIEGYSVQRRLASGASAEGMLVVRRTACDSPTRLAEDSAWPDNTEMSCGGGVGKRSSQAESTPLPQCFDGPAAGMTYGSRLCLSRSTAD